MYFLSNQQEDHYFEANSRQFQTGRPVDSPTVETTYETTYPTLFKDPGLAFSSVADGSQMIYDNKFCDSVADLLVNRGQFW